MDEQVNVERLIAEARRDAEGAYSRSAVASTRLAGKTIMRLADALAKAAPLLEAGEKLRWLKQGQDGAGPVGGRINPRQLEIAIEDLIAAALALPDQA